MKNKCVRCLIRQSADGAAYDLINKYLSNLDSEFKVGEREYKRRLAKCEECDSLLSGTCLKCGCYAQVRAALKDSSCPDYDNPKW